MYHADMSNSTNIGESLILSPEILFRWKKVKEKLQSTYSSITWFTASMVMVVSLTTLVP